MSQHTELIARLDAALKVCHPTGEYFELLRQSRDALQSLERVPMTEEEIEELFQQALRATEKRNYTGNRHYFARAIEAHHGITPPESKG